jgi:SAM-dependent methyltransferase
MTSTSAAETAPDGPTSALPFVCPVCQSLLRQGCGVLECGPCGRWWPVIQGVAQFVSGVADSGPFSTPELRELVSRAEAGNWREALSSHPSALVRQAAEPASYVQRVNWRWLLDLPPDCRILDLGAGLGANSHALATPHSEVFAADPASECVDFMRHRFTQEALPNVRIVWSSVWSLPFAADSFDLAVIDGSLGRIVKGRAGSPRRLEQSALERVSALLRPGGYLYLAVEVGSVLATIAHRRQARFSSAHSIRGYCRLLKAAGFSDVNPYLVLPNHAEPRFFVPQTPALFAYYAHSFNPPPTGRVRRAAYDFLLRLRVPQRVETSFAIFARK